MLKPMIKMVTIIILGVRNGITKMKHILRVLPILSACLSVASNAMSQVDRTVRFPLGSGISIWEVDASNKEYPLHSKSDIYDVDINSSLLIQLDPQSIAASLLGNAPGAVVATIPVSLVEQRGKLLEAMDALNAYVDVSGRIAAQIQTFSTTTEIPGFKELVRQHGQAYKDLKAKIREYLGARSSAGSTTLTPEDEVDQLFDGPQRVQAVNIRNFIQGEISRLDAESGNRADSIKGKALPYSIQLSASLMRAGRNIERVHIPGYDSLQEGEYKPIDKVSFAMTEDDRKKLQTEMDFNRDLATRLNETKNLREGLTVTLTKLYGEQITRIRQFLEDSRMATDLVSQIASAAAADAKSVDVAELIPVDTKASVEADYRNTSTLIRDGSAAVTEFQRKMVEVLPNGMKLSAIAETGDPVTALDQLLQLTSGVPSQAAAAYNELESRFSMIQSSMSSISDRLKQTTAALPSETSDTVLKTLTTRVAALSRMKEVLKTFNTESITPFVASLNTLKNRSADLKGAENSLAVSNGFDPRMIDENTTLRSIDSLVDTKISLPRTSRNEGDQLEVVVVARSTASISEQKAAPVLAERSLLFNVRKFGAYSEFSSGAAAFFGTSTTSNKDAEFGAVASYVVHGRSRDSSTWNFLNPSIGVHTAGISTGLGAGVSVNLLPQNFVQLGFGRTFRSNMKNDWYTFVGIRLFNLKLPTMNQ